MTEKDSYERQEKLGIKLLKNCRNELYREFPFLDAAFSGVDYQASGETKTIGTDGEIFYFDPVFLLKSYAENPASVKRIYLHLLLHCLYLHVLRDDAFQEDQWDLACDLAAEQVIEQMIREEKTLIFFDERTSENAERKQLLQKLGDQIKSAEMIYNRLGKIDLSVSFENLNPICADDHSFWKKLRSPEETEELKKKWEKLLGKSGGGKLGLRFGIGSGKGGRTEDVPETSKSRYDYRTFLKQFAILREEMELDTETFDYIYYTYGLEQYKTMPLVEPLEYKEGHKLEELVIAIDTSGSCSAELVSRFLAESYAILGEKENFFQKMKVYLIQCDCFIQDVAVIHSKEEWQEYQRHIKIQGRAGTDFRPVFAYIEELREKKELKNLKALIYFTDGDGIYPRSAPDYQTAFVFTGKTTGLRQVPPWAFRLEV
ncbi:MAG: hypothetical protein IJW67_00625 [Blautia sp.]|nr:hypothetical protein [Blautia sp.]